MSEEDLLAEDACSLPLEPYDVGEIVAGSPSAGLASPATVGGASVGIWELREVRSTIRKVYSSGGALPWHTVGI